MVFGTLYLDRSPALQPTDWHSKTVQARRGSSSFMLFSWSQARCYIRSMGAHTHPASSVVFFSSFFPKKKKSSCPRSVPPTTQHKRHIHLLRLAVAETPLRELHFSPHRSTMSFVPRAETRRSATMWRTCSVFCAWSLLFLAEVCAQSQQRYTFYSRVLSIRNLRGVEWGVGSPRRSLSCIERNP